jgi:hypothetical protein
MAINIPPQRHRCTRHEWCLARGQGHKVHLGEVHVLSTANGTELRVSLNAEGDQDPVVHVEATFESGGPLMELAELGAAEAVELAGFLLRLARAAQMTPKEVR